MLFDKSQTTLTQFPAGLHGTYAIPNSVTEIAANAFDVASVTNIIIPNSVSFIDAAAFGSSSLTSITIPATVTNLGQNEFIACTNLTAINVDPQNQFYRSLNGVLFDATGATLIEFPPGLGGSYTVPDGVTSLADFSFYSCANLTNVTFSPSVQSLGEYSFALCLGLTNFFIPGTVGTVGSQAFSQCSNLTTVVIVSEGVTNLSFGAFSDSGLTQVTVPASVLSFDSSIFCRLSKPGQRHVPAWHRQPAPPALSNPAASLTNVTLPRASNTIGYLALFRAASTSSIWIFPTASFSSMTSPSSVAPT